MHLFFRCRIRSENDQPVWGDKVAVNIAGDGFRWMCHPIADIAVMPWLPLLTFITDQLGKVVLFKSFPDQIIATKEQLDGYDGIEEVFFVGYPAGIRDEYHLTSMIRRGITASPLQLDFGGDPCFYIDASVFKGSSGSPVVYCRNGGFAPGGQSLSFGTKVSLLGVLSHARTTGTDGRLEFCSTGSGAKVSFEQFLHLGIVWRASLITDLVRKWLHPELPLEVSYVVAQ